MIIRNVVVWICGVLAVSGMALLASKPGPRAGFREFKWGQAPAARMMLREIGVGAEMDEYLIPDESRRVAGLDTVRISYMFWKDKLCEVRMMWLANSRERVSIYAALVGEWGPVDRADVSEASRATYFWRDSKQKTKTTAILSSPQNWSKQVEAENPERRFDWILFISDRQCLDDQLKQARGKNGL